jgi:hypothetical protein
MQLTPYAKLLTMAKDAVNATLAPARAKSQKLKAQLEVSKLEERCASLETEITENCSEKELNYDVIIDKLDELALAERRKEQLTKIINELFPTD